MNDNMPNKTDPADLSGFGSCRLTIPEDQRTAIKAALARTTQVLEAVLRGECRLSLGNAQDGGTR